MSTAYDDLLAATIEHLHQLKRAGRHFVAVQAPSLEALTKPIAQRSLPMAEPPPATPNIPSSLPAAHPPPASADADLFGLELKPAPAQEPLAAAPTPKKSLSAEQKLQAMAELRKRVLACVECKHLVAARRNVVFGVGDVNARLMFVGEAPGADEDRQGEPFVGAAGQLLTKIITTMGLSRQTVYIGNILKCRPDTPGKAFGNRKPTSEEMKTCLHWLEDQIDIIQPEVLVALGATAVEGLLGACSGITKIRGHWHSYRDIPLMPTFHPSYLLRSTSLSDKRKVWEDMLQVMAKLGMPISEKQQNYFK